MSLLVVRGLHKAFGAQTVLTGADLDVPAGSLTAILGPSGSGKTTLLRILAGFDRADAGSVSMNGEVVESVDRHVPAERRHIGYVPQEGALFPHLDVAANVGFGLPRRQRGARVSELLDMTGLGAFARRFPHELSGGQQQRVALARALAPRPAVVLLDEPFSSLDAALRTSVRLDVARVLAEAGTTAVLVTHDQDEALSMASQVAVLRSGRFVQRGSALEVYCAPADADVARFVGDANLVPGTARDGGVVTRLGSNPVSSGRFADGTAMLVLVRPEDVEVEAAAAIADDTGGAPGWVAGTVLAVDYHGHDTVLVVETASAGGTGADPTGGRAPGTIHVRRPGPPCFTPGAPVVVRTAPGAVTAWARDGAAGVDVAMTS